MDATEEVTDPRTVRPSEPWVLRSAARLYATLFLLVAVPAALLIATITLHVRSQMLSNLRTQNELLSGLLAVAIDEELQGLQTHVASVAQRPLLGPAVRARNGTAVLEHIESLVAGNPRIARAFVTDERGIMLFDHPHDPAVIGKDFSHRDWFAGVSASGQVYISEIYQRTALGSPLVVSIAGPVHDADGAVAGYLVGQYPLADLCARMAALAPTDSTTFALIDQHGNAATAATEGSAQAGAAETGRRTIPPGLDLSAPDSQIVLMPDGKEHLFSVEPVASAGWMAIAHHSLESVTGPVRSLLTTIGVLFVLTCAALAVLGGILTRALWRYNTALRRADAALRLAKVAAEDANATKSEFLANMSHEIRTPMMAIIGYADLLADRARPADEQVEAVRVIRRNANHLLTIINDILDLSKIEAGEMRVECVECSPCRILYDVYSLMRVRASEKGLEFKTRVSGVIPETIRTDPTRLRQILINLVGNAIKFTDAGRVCITTHLIEPGDGGGPLLRIDVADTGIGMNHEQMDRLFRPFAQADTSTTRRFGGTGLGLVICDRLARMLGGRIEVDSAPDRGSTFSLFISTGPLEGVRRLTDCREALLERERGERVDHSSTRLRGRVLLVEDGKDNRDLLALYLRIAGAEVIEAENGQVACERVAEAMDRTDDIDAVLLDMQMPVLDGYGAARRMREAGFDRPIIALTAHAMAEDRARCLAAGCTDYLSKPVSQADLLRTLAAHLPARERSDDAPEGAAGGGSDMSRRPTRLDPDDPVVSQISEEILRPYVEAFIEGIPARIAEIEAHLRAGDLEALGSLIHQIKGSGGLFGFMSVTSRATAVEEHILTRRSFEAIRREVEALVALLERIRSRPAETPPTEAATG